MVALLVSLLIAAGLLIAAVGIVLALEARGALWLDLIVHGARPFDAAIGVPVVKPAVATAPARRRAAA